MKLISVLMCVYNTPEEYLRESIESILNQTYKKIEFIIVDDCSDLNTKNILNSYRDSRICLYHNEMNLGLTRSLNIGLHKCNGDYVARMDSDDIAYPNRLEMQLEYIQKSNYIAIGSEYEFLPKKHYQRFMTEDLRKQKIRMIFSNAGIIHSTAFFDREKMERLGLQYNEEYKKSQDYGLWCDFMLTNSSLGNCPYVLLKWRESPGQISKVNSGEQKACRDKIRYNYIKNLITIDDKDANYLVKNFDGNIDLEEKNIKQISDCLIRIMKNNPCMEYLQKEICSIWMIQMIRRLRNKRFNGTIVNKMTVISLKPSNVLYFIKVLKNDRKKY